MERPKLNFEERFIRHGLNHFAIPQGFKTDRDQSKGFEGFEIQMSENLRRANNLGIDIGKFLKLVDIFLSVQEVKENGEKPSSGNPGGSRAI